MRKKTIELLSCPNSGSVNFEIYAKELIRGEKKLYNLNNSEIIENDKIISGILINKSSDSIYPIIQTVAILLSDEDADVNFINKYFEKFSEEYPIQFKKIINRYLIRLNKMKKTAYGKWNEEEKRYYDQKVESKEQRDEMLSNIKTNPIWNIFIPRKEQIIKYLDLKHINPYLLEIGCGNSRTISWIYNPRKYRYNYIGVDISFKQLLVASRNIPEGDFIQASALNLPFKNNTFHSIISFGMLHHLPDPLECIEIIDTKLINQGFFFFHEPIIKPKIIGEKSIICKFLTTYDHSEHDNEIDVKKSLTLLKSLNYQIENLKYYNSVFRTITQIILGFFPNKISNNRILVKIVLFMDSFFLKTICKFSKRLGPHSIFGTFRKNNK